MNGKKHLIQRYTLATLVGFGLGLIGLFAAYENYIEGTVGMDILQVDHFAIELSKCGFKPGTHNAVRLSVHEKVFLEFLIENNWAVNILFGSIMLVPLTLYTYDRRVPAQSRRHSSMRLYLGTAISAEVIGILLLFTLLLFWSPQRFAYNDALDHYVPKGPYCSEREWVALSHKLEKHGRTLAYQLDLLDNCAPFVIGAPALAVLTLWSYQRRRKQNPSAGVRHLSEL